MDPLKLLQEDMKTALRAHDTVRLDAVRFLMAQVKNVQIDKPGHAPVTEPEFMQITKKLVKNSEESIAQFKAGNRTDLVEEEEAKLAFWKAYLPEQLSEEAIRQLAQEVITASSAKEMGPLIGQVMAKTAGRADGGTVSRIVRELLQS